MRPTPLIPLLFLFAACSDDPAAEAGGGGDQAPPPVRVERSDDPRAEVLRGAIEDARLGAAKALLEELSPDELGAEYDLCAARIAFLEDDELEVTRRIEAARAAHPRDPRVFATAAELFAMGGKEMQASDELQRGITACGPTPELLRAQGVRVLYSPAAAGKPEPGLAKLEQALAADPELPFTRWPLSEAHRLVGQALRGTDDHKCEAHLVEAMRIDGSNREARDLLAELLMTQKRYAQAIELYEGLMADGDERAQRKLAEACMVAGAGYLLVKDRTAAVQYYLRARELGVEPAAFEQDGMARAALENELFAQLEEARASFAAGDNERAELILEVASALLPGHPGPNRVRTENMVRRKIDHGVELLQGGDAEGAKASFELAFQADPDSYEVRNWLATVHGQLGEYAEAARHWHRVLDLSRLDDVELPGPVHLQLANVLVLDQQYGEARAALEDYLLVSPKGEYAETTRQLLAKLDGAPAPDADR